MSETEEHLLTVAPGGTGTDAAPLMLSAPETVNNNPNAVPLKYHVAVRENASGTMASLDKGIPVAVYVQVIATSDAEALEAARQIWMSRHGLAMTKRTEFSISHAIQPGYTHRTQAPA